MKHIYLITAVLLLPLLSFAQRGKDGPKTVSTANNVVNEYTALTANATAGSNTLTVASSTLNANSRFTGPLAPGDLVMIIQMQGATLNGTLLGNIAIPNDSTWGQVTSYNNCGNNEFAEVLAVPNGTTITLRCGLQNSYTSTGRAQVIRVPRYTTLTVNSGGVITCDTWNGTVGGVCAIEVQTNTVINTGGSINANGKGFRGGMLLENNSGYGVDNIGATGDGYGAEKGEGIGGYQADYDLIGGRYGKGAAGNGGGGGNGHNGGGGGGGNGGNPALWNGHGSPDLSVAGYAAAWNQEYSWKSTTTSPGGGKGGYTFSGSNQNATTLGPTVSSSNLMTAWGGDYRRNHGGFGGRPVDYSTGKLFLGGGGGSGDQNDNTGGTGGNGGGLIYLMNYGTVSGGGQVVSNGNNGSVATGPAPTTGWGGKDAAGGGGAGGTIIINSVGTITGISATANGGAGGNQVLTRGSFYFGAINEAEGPGGGGGGGYIAVSNGAITQTVNGGNNGTTNSDALTEFPPNGATRGGAGSTGTVSNFTITANNVSICSGNTATLTATLNGTVPPGAVINWYSAAAGGTLLFTGSSFTTPVLTSTTTYYVGTCPGTYTQAVTVTVTPGFAITTSGNASICPNGTVQLSASAPGAISYSWSPAASLSNATISNPIASPTVTTTYTVTISNGSCTSTASVTVTVSPAVVANAGPDVAVCAGGSTTLSASGGVSYSWTPATGLSNANISNPVATPGTTTTYTVTVTDGSGCSNTDAVVVTVNSLPTANAGQDVSICNGASTTLSASGGNTYSWVPSATLSNANISNPVATPSVTTVYTVTVTDGNGCSNTDAVTVTVNPSPTANAGQDVSICSGGSTTLSASGGTGYSWSPAATLSSATISNPVASPTATTTYTVTVSDANGCSNTDMVTVTVNTLPAASAGPDVAICNGSSTNLSASGGAGYSWNPSATLSSATVANPVASPTVTTTYTVTVTDANGCSNTDDVTVTVDALPVASAGPDAGICGGGSVNLSASGGTSYSWSPAATLSSATIPNPVAAPTVTTTYTVTVTGANGCTNTDSVIVAVNSAAAADAGPNAQVCSGGSTTLNASGGITYSWSPAASLSNATVSNPVATPASTTTYTVTVTDANGCTGIDSVTVTIAASMSVSAGSDLSICSGSSIQLSVSGNGSYSWSPAASLNSSTISSPLASPTVTTTYTVVVTDPSGCQGSDTITVNVSPALSLSASSGTTICIGQSATLSASSTGGTGTISYTWDNSLAGNGPHTVSPTATTTYNVFGTDSLGCISSTQSITITVNPPLSLSAAASQPTICQGSTVTLNATAAGGDGTYTYTWLPAASGSSITVSPSATTTYTVVVSDGCGTPADSSTVTVTVVSTPVVTVATSMGSGCAPVCVDFSSTTTSGTCSTTAWDFGDGSTSTQAAPTYCYTNPGTYNVTYVCTDANGCSGTANATVDVYSNPSAAFTMSSTLIIYDPNVPAQVCFTDNTTGGATTWGWDFGDGTGLSILQNPCYTYSDTGTYCVTLVVQNMTGCSDSVTSCVRIISELEYSIPNVFTPNGDGVNDVFAITSSGVKELRCEIYNRWGTKLYEWNNLSGSWDGRTTSGQMAEDGVYYYMAVITGIDGTTKEERGFVQMIRQKK